MGIVENGIVKFDKISQRIEGKIAELESLSSDVRDALISTGNIVAFADKTAHIDLKPIITVDGAKILEQLSHTDLLVTGASIGEGGYLPPSYEDNEVPSTSYVELLQHDSKNSESASALMALQELALIGVILEDNPDAIAVIDGSWTSSLTSIIISLTQGNKKVLRTSTSLLYDFLLENQELINPLKTAISAIVNPENANATRIIALSKSDSKSIWIDRLKDISVPLAEKMEEYSIKDRALASTILQPGEALSPTYMDAGQSLISSLEKWKQKHSKISLDKNRNKKEIKDTLQWILDYTLTNAEKLSLEQGAKLWSLYFKPSVFTGVSKSLRLEFIRKTKLEHSNRPQDDSIEILNDALPYIHFVNTDMNNDQILEPWCQFIADRNAKQVSDLATIIRSQLASGKHAAFFLNNYRT